MIAEKRTEVNYRVKPVTRLPYPAGIYSSTMRYTCSANVAPYVVFQPNTAQDAVRYVMNKVGTWLGTEQGMTPAEDYAKNGENATWLPFEHFNAIEIELALIQFAKKKAIFYDQYMFSQNGFDANGNTTADYKDFSPEMDKFTPMILLDFLKGTGHLGGKSIRFDELGRIIMKSDMVYEWRVVNEEPTSHVSEYNIDFGNGSLIDVSTDAFNKKIDTIVIPPTTDVTDGFQFRIRGRMISRNDYPSDIKSSTLFCAKINGSYQTFNKWSISEGYTEEYIVSKGNDGLWYISSTREIVIN